MKMRFLAFLAAVPIASLSAQAGTIVFHTGDALHPPVGVDAWSYGTSGSVVSWPVTPTHIEHATMGTDVYVEEVKAEFSHYHHGGQPPRTPELGTTGGQGWTQGNVYWWFEYVPDNGTDVPDPNNSYYADIQIRGQASILSSAVILAPGASCSDSGAITGLLTNISAYAYADDGTPSYSDPESTGSPWNFQETPTGFNFTWDATLSKWIGKAQFVNAAGTLFDSLATVTTFANAAMDGSFNRQLKVLRVRTPGGATFTFNTAWS